MTLIPKFENMLSWGNVITIGLLLVGGITAFSNMKTESAYMKAALDSMIADQRDYEVRLRALELGSGRVEEKLNAITLTLQRIDKVLSESYK